ncbi:solute carrier family 23 protein [endosymbiont 'TC1' of Trimyema compressum]|uniref:solute carrier family 23 protein n=1 Tax=endosymbiont 'TC1' of Trimyema compressum TaxID=243899 RepID=UPI001FE0FDA8|nr:solute carrier family 23 protein [endosymbiont 'TC1' of Trimyema compressum]
MNLFGQCFGAIPGLFSAEKVASSLTVIATVLFVNFFDTTGTLLSVTKRAGLIEKDGQPKNIGKALFADSITTAVGAVMGTSSVTTCVESLTGVEVGGKTGLTSFFTGIFS